jgi:SAM-dependent methyltransferase
LQPKAARCGEPSYVWRDGQQRRLEMILRMAGERAAGFMLENGCGVGLYADRLAPGARHLVGLEYDLERARQASKLTARHPDCTILCAAGEKLPFKNETFDLVLSHEVLEHVQDDRRSAQEMVRILKTRGRIVLFVPNRGYPFETHGIFWRGVYHFGNIPLVNYLPRRLRDRLAPHVRAYTGSDLRALFSDLPVRIVHRTVIFGAYDNIIARWSGVGRMLRATLQFLEKTPLRFLGLSHFWVVEKVAEPGVEASV